MGTQLVGPLRVIRAPGDGGGSGTTVVTGGSFGHLRASARRRWAVVVLAVVLGAVGAIAVGVALPAKYQSTTVLVVPSGAVSGVSGPGQASEADNLAATYAGLIPQDQTLQRIAAVAAGMSTADAAQAMAVTVQSGSAILTLRFTASTPKKALLGAEAVARAITGPSQGTPAIPAGSLVLVALPQKAARSSASLLKSATLGTVLGLVLGLILAVAWERSDPRVDDLDDLREVVEAPCWPGELAPGAATSLVYGWTRDADDEIVEVAFLHLGRPDGAAVSACQAAIVEAGGDQVEVRDLDLRVGGPQGAVEPDQPVVLLVATGTKLDAVTTSVRKLSELRASVSWAFLLPTGARGQRHRGSASPVRKPPPALIAAPVGVPLPPVSAEPGRGEVRNGSGSKPEPEPEPEPEDTVDSPATSG